MMPLAHRPTAEGRHAGHGERRPAARLLFLVHGWLGFKLAILMFVICITGTIATLSHEIDWLANPAIRAAPDEGAASASWGTLLASVEASRPGVRVDTIHAPPHRWAAAQILVRLPDGRHRLVYVDPYTGRVQGETSLLNVARFFRDFHRFLFLPSSFGLYTVCLFSFLLLGSLVTGIIVYKKWWRGFFRLRTGKGARVFWGDLHKLAGVWSLWFVAIIAVTGMWYFVERGFSDLGHRLDIRAPAIPAGKLAGHGSMPRSLDLDRLIATAQAVRPDLEIRTVRLPSTMDEPLYVDGQNGTVLVRDRANRVYLNPFDGAVIGVQRAEELELVDRWVDTADPIHFGDFAGLSSKLVWFVCGLLVSGLILSGGWLVLRHARESARRVGPPPASGGHRVSRMGVWRYVNIGVLCGAVVSMQWQLKSYEEESCAMRPVAFAAGPWRASAWVHAVVPADGGAESLSVSLDISCGDGCRPNVRHIVLTTLADKGDAADSVRIAHDDDPARRRRLRLPEGSAVTLRIAIEDWEGERHAADQRVEAAAVAACRAS